MLSGALGFFWTDVADLKNEDNTRRGQLRRVDDFLQVETLTEELDGDFMRGRDLPDLLIGALNAGSVVIPDVTGVGRSFNWGAGRSSSETFRARSLLFGIGDLLSLRSGRVLEVSAMFPAALSWAGLQVDESKVTTDGQNRVQEVSITLKRVKDPPGGRLGNGLTLVLRGHWQTSGGRSPGEPRQITTALEIVCRSTTPRHVADLVRPLEEAQNLLSLALDGWVDAAPGRAVLDTLDRQAAPQFWTGRLMVPPPGARPMPSSPLAFFSLRDLGGARGLARWVRLCMEHPRAVTPLTAPLRSGGRLREEYLRSVAAAIEYWVTANKKTWGKGFTSKGFYSRLQGLVRHAGSHAAKLLGDSTKWADALTEDYNKLKHDPAAVIDPRRVGLLAMSGRLLLECTLLDDCAGTRAVSRRFASDYRLQEWTKELTKIY